MHLGLFCCCNFNFSSYFFDFLSWPFCRSFICFQYHHSILICQILYSLIWSLFFWFLIFFPWPFYKSFIDFQFYPLIKIDGIIFFNLIFIVLISNFFIGTFVKVIILFNSTIQSKYYFYFFMSILIFIIFYFFGPFAKLIYLFNFTFQLNKELIFFSILILILLIAIFKSFCIINFF